MSDYSRVKKFKKLRNDIQNEMNEPQSISETLKNYNNTIVKEEEKYEPVHEKIYESKKVESTEPTTTFKNEYLDSFIQEVREYNMQKGIRENEDTKLDILNQLTSKNRERRNNYIEKVSNEEPVEIKEEKVEELSTIQSLKDETPEDDQNNQTMEISRQLFEMLNEDDNSNTNEIAIEENVEEPVEETTEEVVEEAEEEKAEEPKVESELEKRIAALEERTVSFEKIHEETDDDVSEITKKELLEETQKIKKQMDTYEDNLKSVNEDVSNNNRILNIIIGILVVALLAVIGLVIYWLYTGGIL